MFFKVTMRHTVLILLLITGLSACSPADKKPLNQYEHAVQGAFDASLSRDGKYSVVSSAHHGLSLWDIENDALKYQWSHQGTDENVVLASYIADDNSYALTADRKNFVLWNIETGEAEGFWQVRESDIRDVALSNKGRHILIGKKNGVVVHVDRETGRRIEFLGHQEKINAVDISPNGRYAISGSNDYVAYLWDTQTGQVVYRFNHGTRVTAVAFDPKGRFALTADSLKQATIWDLTNGQAISQLKDTRRQLIFTAARFNQDGTLLATGSPNRRVVIWDVKTGKKLDHWNVHARKLYASKGAVVYSIAFVDNDTKLLTESSSGIAELWSLDK